MKGIFEFFDKDDNLIEEKSILKLDFKRKVIVNKSIEMFNDEDPCIIHYTYSTKKVAFELLENIKKNYKEKELEFLIEEWPFFIERIFKVPENTCKIKIR